MTRSGAELLEELLELEEDDVEDAVADLEDDELHETIHAVSRWLTAELLRRHEDDED